MILTEEEAKTKWCPEVRTGLTAGMAVNTHIGSYGNDKHAGDVHEETRCIGSGCMMWRWYLSDGHNGIDRTKGDDNSKGRCGKASP